MIAVARAALLLAYATSVAAASPARALEEYNAGQELYRRGEFVPAAARFQNAYDLDRDPTYLFNLAQALRLAKDCERAAAAYRSFLAEVRAPPNRDRVEQYIAQMDACTVSATTPTHRHTRRDRVVGISLGGGGVVGLGVGVALVVKAERLENEREMLCRGCTWDSTFEARANDLDARGARASRLGVIAMIVGTGLVATGGYLYWTSRSRERAIAIVTTGRGVSAIGRF